MEGPKQRVDSPKQREASLNPLPRIHFRIVFDVRLDFNEPIIDHDPRLPVEGAYRLRAGHTAKRQPAADKLHICKSRRRYPGSIHADDIAVPANGIAE
jgi:hypothetical protein